MKVSNLLQLTDHHRCRIVRRFSLSPLDWRMLWTAYQPLIGAGAAALYGTLCAALPSDISGESEPTTLGRLLLSCGLQPNAEGRGRLVDETARLEAAGLLQTLRRWDGDEIVEYEFHLSPPLLPDQFFDRHHLWYLLQEVVGPAAAETIRDSILRQGWGGLPSEEAAGERVENISVPFSEVFRLAASPPEKAAPAEPAFFAPVAPAADEFGRDGFRGDELLRRFPRSSPHRRWVEQLAADPHRLAALNYIAGKYQLTLKQTASLLDEDGAFDGSGRWSESRFEARAAELYRGAGERKLNKERLQAKREQAPKAAGDEAPEIAAGPGAAAEREVAEEYWLKVPEQFAGQCDVRQYNAMLANMPYTRVLELFFEPSAVPPPVMEAFLTMSVNYRLPDEVINVLIHYIRVNDLDWKRSFLDAIAANVAGRRIRTFEHAVTYFFRGPGARGGAAGDAGDGRGEEGKAAVRRPGDGAGLRQIGRRGKTAERPVIPVARGEPSPEASDEEIQRIMEMARKLSESH